MARGPDPRMEQARNMFLSGKKLTEIATTLDVPEGTVRSWKNRYEWDCNVAIDKRNVAKEKSKSEGAVGNEVIEVLENSDLTSKQQLFCCFYVKSFNATKAYQKAYGVSYTTAASAGPRMLENVRIKKAICELKQGRLNREMLSEEDIFQKYMDIAFADITDYVEFGRETVPVMGPFGPVIIKDEKTGEKVEIKKEINVVRFKESIEVDGTLISEVKQGKDGASIKLSDRMKALQWLAEHMDFATEEQKAKIELIKAQTEKVTREQNVDDDDGVEIINDAPKETD